MRIVLVPYLLRRDRSRVSKPTPGGTFASRIRNEPDRDHRIARSKKKAAAAALTLRRQARPASWTIILDFLSYAKSPAQRFRQDRYR
jgi:hypothetical protein